MTELSKVKHDLIEEIEKRVEDHVLEPSNAELLNKLIMQADNDNEALSIATLGTMYKKTGLHFDARLEPITAHEIRYFRKDTELSFHTNDSKPTHKLIIGDNYEALQNLLVQYTGKIDVIYIDPPYGKDSMGEFAQTNYQNAITRDNLLSMLYPRLQLAKQLLSDSGVIFCSIDDKNQAYIKCLFDEIFGEKNFVANFIWKSRQNKDNRNITGVSIDHEYVLCYSNTAGDRKVKGTERKVDQYSNPDNDPRGPWASGNMVGLLDETQRPNCHYDLINPATGINYGKPKMGWRYDKNTMNKLIEENRILWPDSPNGRPRKKTFLSEISEVLPGFSSIIGEQVFTRDGTSEVESIFNQRPFGFPKPVELIKELLEQTTTNDSVILDFFAGSGTTGHAVLDINRSEEKDGDLFAETNSGGNRTFILCQMNEKTDTTPNGIAYDVTAKRLKRIMTGECYDGTKDFEWIKKNKPYGGNLDVYEIDKVADFNYSEGKSPFDVIDETLYGQPKFASLQDKIDWVCTHFADTRKTLVESAQAK